jgi:hypothetical protein
VEALNIDAIIGNTRADLALSASAVSVAVDKD